MSGEKTLLNFYAIFWNKKHWKSITENNDCRLQLLNTKLTHVSVLFNYTITNQ